ncbi:MAG: DUF3021 domain-containing protein [Ruminococcus sp.]|uniref:DUF3021 domain-containing protein n=2 Tax=Ruminococcus sp. TaxID=41978 RepID=UPI003993FCAA
MKEKLRRLMNYITTITTGTLIACIFWGGISILTMGSSLTEANINFLMLPEILSVGIFCGLITELAFYSKREPKKKTFWIWIAVHYIAVTIVVLICGYFYHWYCWNVGNVIAMCLTSAGVYGFTFFLNYYRNKIIANAMNEKLEQYHSKHKKEGDSQ